MDATTDPPPIEFRAYRDFRRRFDARFGALCREFPAAASVINLPLSLLEQTGEDHSERYFRHWLQGASRWNQMCNHLQRTAIVLSRGATCVDWLCGRFPLVSNAIREIAEERGLRVLQAGMPQQGRFRKLVTATRQIPLAAAISSSRPVRGVLESTIPVGLAALLDSRQHLQELESAALQRIHEMESLLTTAGVRFIISADDAHGPSRMVMQAAKNLGIPTAVVAHGYAVHPELRAICPPMADALIVWTVHQRDEIRKVIEPELVDRVQYCGFPRAVTLAGVPAVSDGDCVIAASLMVELLADNAFRGAFADVVTACQRQCRSVRVRRHPKERSHPGLAQFLSTLPVVVDERPIDTALQHASVVVGAESSVLIESAFSGVPSFQIRQLRPLARLERLPLLNVSDLSDLATLCEEFRERVPAPDTSKQMTERLKNLITDCAN